jgi:cysteine desulfurase
MMDRMENESIYCDYQATTPVDPRVFAEMTPFFLGRFGNPHAEENLYGQAAAMAVAQARVDVSGLIGADPREITFTSGATEANNLLIQGVVAALQARGRTHVITAATEHKSVLEPMAALRRQGFVVTVLPVGSDGHLDFAVFEAALRPQTGLVSLMAANNEIGILHPLAQIGEVCRRHGILFHTDAAQAAGKVPIDLKSLPVDLMSLSGHKIYGPMGIGAAYARREARVRLSPLVHGGGQEGGVRPGTVPLPLCVGLGAACRLAQHEMTAEASRLLDLRGRLLGALRASGAAFEVNGDLVQRLPGNLNLSFAGVDAEALLMTLRNDVAMSTGSACAASHLEPSHVIMALGLGEDRAESAVRLGLGRMTTEAEVDLIAARIASAVHRLRYIRYQPRSAGAARA